MKLARIATLCALAVLATAAEASSSTQAAAALPCGAAFHRLAGGTRLSVNLTCTTANVVIVRVQFPPTVKLRAQTSFPGGGCRLSTASTWYCLFGAGVPVNKKLTGSVRFAKPIPRARQHGRLDFYFGTFSSGDGPPAMVGINPSAQTGTFAY